MINHIHPNVRRGNVESLRGAAACRACPASGLVSAPPLFPGGGLTRAA